MWINVTVRQFVGLQTQENPPSLTGFLVFAYWNDRAISAIGQE